MSPNRSDMQAARKNRGFVLVVVLVALVILTLLATAIATSSERAMQEARRNSEAFEAEVAMTSTRDTLLFMSTTQRRTFGGLTVDKQVVWSVGAAAAARPSPDDDSGVLPMLPVGTEIRYDGTPYAGLRGARFALRDDGGRFSPNWAFEIFRPRFFEQLGVPAELHAEFEAKRLDYQDPDDLFRLGGAEKDDYVRFGMAPPTNRALVTPLELRRIMGWADALRSLDDRQITSRLTADRTVMINVNTAPPEVLQTIPGMKFEAARRVVASRQSLPFMLSWRFIDDFKLPLDELAPIGFLATDSGTLELWHNAGGPTRLLHWTLTPTNEGGRPWRFDYSLVLPRDAALDQTPPRQVASPLFANPGPPG